MAASKNRAFVITLLFITFFVVQDEKLSVEALPLAEAAPNTTVSITIKSVGNDSVIFQLNNCQSPFNITIRPKQNDPCYSKGSCQKTAISLVNQIKCEITATNLCPNSIYAIEINKTGVNVTTLPNLPTEKITLKVDGKTPNTLSLSWNALKCPTNYNYQYIISYKTPNDVSFKNATAAANTKKITISKLTPYTQYTFQLRVCVQKDLKQCQDAAKIDGKTTPLPPGPPTSLTVSELKNDSFTFTWLQPTIPGSPVISYKVKCTEDKKSKIFVPATDSKNRKHDCKKLKPYTQYYYSVITTVKYPDSEALDSVESEIEELQTRPSAPSKPNIVKIETASYWIEVKWEAPKALNGKIDFYTITTVHGQSRNTVKHIDKILKKRIAVDSYTNYTVYLSATNLDEKTELKSEDDIMEITSLAGKPSAPVDLKAFNVNDTCILRWKAPEQKNGPLDGYKIFWTFETRDGDNFNESAWEAIVMSNTTEFNIDEELIAWREYTFEVEAFNIAHKSKLYGDKAITKILGPVAAPYEPTNVEVVLSDITGNIKVTWMPPVPVTGPTKYEITLETATADVKNACSQPKNLTWTSTVFKANEWKDKSVDAEQWTKNKCYRAKVKAITSVDAAESEMSKVQSSVDLNKRPSEPLDVKAVPISKDSVSVSWKTPAVKNGDLSFLVKCGLNETEGIFVPADNKTLTHSCVALKVYTAYYVTVVATIPDPNNKEKVIYGLESKPVKVITKASTPGKPIFKAVEAISSHQIRMKWGKPIEANGPIDFYRLYGYNEKGKKVVDEIVRASEKIVKGLEPYEEYNLVLIAVNIVDKKDLDGDHVSIKIRTYAGAPGVCDNVKATVQNTSNIKVTWEPPTFKRGPINGYVLRWKMSSEPDSKEKKLEFLKGEKEYLITGLNTGTEYKIHINAFNEFPVKQREEGTVETLTVYIKATNPIIPFTIKITNSTKDSAKIIYSPEDNDYSTKFSRYHIIVGSAKALGKGGINGTKGQDVVDNTYAQAKDLPEPIYIASPENWKPLDMKVDSLNCVTDKKDRICTIGFQSNCTGIEYCNGPLRKSFAYGVKIRGYSDNGDWTETLTAEFKTSGSAVLTPSFLISLLVAYVFYKKN